jgi:DNA-binding IclR family transcriptional regulator
MQGLRRFTGDKLFGTARRTEVLKALALLEETYARELARLLGAPLLTVQRLVDALERDAIVVTRRTGNERRINFNPRFHAVRELRALLLAMATVDDRIVDAVKSLRRRPRRKGKPLGRPPIP